MGISNEVCYVALRVRELEQIELIFIKEKRLQKSNAYPFPTILVTTKKIHMNSCLDIIQVFPFFTVPMRP